MSPVAGLRHAVEQRLIATCPPGEHAPTEAELKAVLKLLMACVWQDGEAHLYGRLDPRTWPCLETAMSAIEWLLADVLEGLLQECEHLARLDPEGWEQQLAHEFVDGRVHTMSEER